jgi:hypothetical protein
MKLERHSPSSLQLFAASPALFVMERVLGFKHPVGTVAHRGVAVEDGVTYGLNNPTADPQEAINVALTKFDTIAASSSDPNKDSHRSSIEVMVLRALKELLPYGIPSATQKWVEWRPEGLKCPIVGMLDYEFAQHGALIDLKTTSKMPSCVKISHARQTSFYAISDNYEARVTYCTPTKVTTYRVDNVRAHREALHKIALTVERFLDLTEDPKELVNFVVPDLDAFWWNSKEARAHAHSIWGI